MPGRLGVDVTSAITGTTGVARYTVEVVRALRELPGAPAVALAAVGRAVVRPPVALGPVRHLAVPLRAVGASWRRGGPPRFEQLTPGVDTIHAAGPVLPTARVPLVGVVHDVAPLRHPDEHPPRDVEQLRRYLAELPRTAAVVTGSAATASLLSALVPEADVHVTPWGRTPLGDPSTVRPLDRPYVLLIGAPVPRKRFPDVLEAVGRLGPGGPDVVLVGPDGADDERVAGTAARLGLSDRFHRHRAVPDEALATWYAHAAAVVVPSTEEGFSFPVIEAQHHGAPVIATDLEVHHEVSGGHATFVPVAGVAELAEALEATVAAPPAAASVEAARANAERFTWSACAAATLAVHRAVA